MEKKISVEDLKNIQDHRVNMSIRSLQVEKAVLENQIAELQYQNAMLRLYVKHGLDDSYTINYDTGEVIKKEPFVVGDILLSEADKKQVEKEVLDRVESLARKDITKQEDKCAFDDLARATDLALEYEINRSEQD